jgi:hypothetical protein
MRRRLIRLGPDMLSRFGGAAVGFIVLIGCYRLLFTAY